ncbi:MAG: FtsQ-type POTRA domain-containing protein [Oscillospiraceae bacterium]|nr:FtsQ-type POTRA domain-containing protein [Oscillospiraceae bacterium]
MRKTTGNVKTQAQNTGVRTRRKRRKSQAGRIVLAATVIIVAITAAILSLTVFFNIKAIDIYGESKYSSKQIIKAAGVELDSNLIRLKSKEVEKKIEDKLPYIQNAKIVKKLPTSLEIRVQSAVVAGYIEENGNFSLVSVEGKLLENLKTRPEGYAEIIGVSAENVKLSQTIKDENGSLKSVEKIYSAFNSQGQNNITKINVSDSLNMSFVYRNRITVELGSTAELDEKLNFVSKILKDTTKIGEDDVGTMYASNARRISYRRSGSYEEILLSEKENMSSSEISQNESQNSSTSSKKD